MRPKMHHFISVAIIFLVLSGLLFFPPTPILESNYGNYGGVVLIGGGSEFPKEVIAWVKNHSRGNNFLVIGCDYLNFNLWKKRLAPFDFDYIILTSREETDNIENLRKVVESHAIFLDGGSQEIYINLLANTLLSKEINKKINGGNPAIGTSAGAMILGQYIFTGKHGSLTSEEAIKNPGLIDIEEKFFNIPFLQNIVIDSHYSERHREGRLHQFLLKTRQLFGLKDIWGIGIDENTAICIDRFGNKKIYGTGKVYWNKLINEEMLVIK